MIRLLLALLLVIATPAAAQVPATPHVTLRADTLFALLGTGKAAASDFTPTFIEHVPLERLSAIAADLRSANGSAVAIERLVPDGANGGYARIAFERATVTVRFALEPTPPHRFIDLLVTDVAQRDDSFDQVLADVHNLPGQTSLLVTEIGLRATTPLVAHQADLSLATGSVFKLFVLAELARQVEAGARRWSDVVPLGAPSLPSGVTQGWPAGAPATLSTLATQMISISDNTAADTLLGALGRERVDGLRESIGATPGSLPMLATREAFALKMTERADLRERWARSSMAERRALLASNPLPLASIDMAQLVGAPRHIDTVEWPATARGIVGVLDRLRQADRHTLDILAVAPALSPGERERFAYVGYKGGSESGVIALAWLLRTRDGRWFAVAGTWNDASAPVDNAKFTALMTRAVALIGR